jgi:hypothetical protein
MMSLLVVKKFYITGTAAGRNVDQPLHYPRTIHSTHYHRCDVHHAIVLIERYFIVHSQHSVQYESMGTPLIAHIH